MIALQRLVDLGLRVTELASGQSRRLPPAERAILEASLDPAHARVLEHQTLVLAPHHREYSTVRRLL